MWIFFALSGFLLAQPFILKPETYSPRGMGTYVGRRLLRILPMYISYVVFVTFHYQEFDTQWMWNHISFQKANFHLWTIKQELIFYLLLPLLALIIKPFKNHHLIKALILITLGALAAEFLTQRYFRVTAIASYARLFIAPFLFGMAGAYIFHATKKFNFSKHIDTFRSTYITIVLLFPIALSLLIAKDFLAVRNANVAWHYHGYLGALYTIWILWLLNLPIQNYIYRFFNSTFFRAIGIVGYSFYLIHWTVIEVVGRKLQLSPYPKFFTTLVITYILSCITYCMIEKPGMRLFKILKRKPKTPTISP